MTEDGRTRCLVFVTRARSGDAAVTSPLAYMRTRSSGHRSCWSEPLSAGRRINNALTPREPHRTGNRKSRSPSAAIGLCLAWQPGLVEVDAVAGDRHALATEAVELT